MTHKRMIVLDIASLGLGEAPDANRFDSIGADTLGHIADKGLNVSNLINLGLGNVRWDNEIKSIPQVDAPRGFFGKMVTTVDSNRGSASFREMFDYTAGVRTASVMDLLAEKQHSVSIISSFAYYWEKQDDISMVQVPDDSKAFIELSAKMRTQKSGLIYCQLPELRHFARMNDSVGYAKQLNVLDETIGKVLERLRDNDLLLITSSYAIDPTRDNRITREYLPLIVFNPNKDEGKSLGIKRSLGAVANAIIAFFDLDDGEVTKPNFINEVM